MAVGAVLSLLMTLFIKNTSLYTGGTSSFFFGIARLVQSVLLMHGLLLVLLELFIMLYSEDYTY